MAAWLAVDQNGDGYIYPKKPYRGKYIWVQEGEFTEEVYLPSGFIYDLIERNLRWCDDPVELIKKNNKK